MNDRFYLFKVVFHFLKALSSRGELFLVVVGFVLLLLNRSLLSVCLPVVTPENSLAPSERRVLLDHPFEFAACLLLKDGNQIIPEWISYHYTVLPLRHLIVAVDPFSLTSPEKIFEKFREIGMNITLWTDKDYFPKDSKFWEATKAKNGKFQTLIMREEAFYSQCLGKFRNDNINGKGNHTWVALVSDDEYIIFNYFDSNEGVPNRCESANETKTLECYQSFLTRLREGSDPRARLPSIRNKTVAHFIASERNKDPLWNFSCVVLPRVIFGGIDSTLEELPKGAAPFGFQNRSLHTTRYLKHEPKKNQWPGKSIVDITRFDQKKLENVHIASHSKCNNGWGAGWGVQHYADVPLRIQHYTGSLEQFLSRAGDYNRNGKNYQLRQKGVTGNLTDFSMIGWLHAFVDIVGKRKAVDLTEGLRSWALKNDIMARKKFQEEKELFRYQFLDPDDYEKYPATLHDD